MNPDPSTTTSTRVDHELAAVLDAYIEKLETGSTPDRQALLDQHPNIAGELKSCFASLDFIGIAGIEAIGSEELIGGRTRSKRLGNFILQREIGRGGMGVVYEAEETSLRRRVAIKILPFASMLDAHKLKRFKLEAQSAASLTHPHIVPVHSIGYECGVHFYVMKLIDGPSLDTVISHLRSSDEFATRSSQGTQPAHEPNSSATNRDAYREATSDTQPIAALSTEYSSRRQTYYRSVIRLGIQAAKALEYAHRSNIVHRDIKPSNLILNSDGHLLVADFGLAQTTSDISGTMSSRVAGTLRYMSPEQAAGKRSTLDGRTDVYSLGATLYEQLTLQPAFHADDRSQLLLMVTQEQPTPPSWIDARIPRDLETIILKAMSKDPSLRYDTAHDFAEDLQNFLDRRPIKARRTGPFVRLAGWMRRNRVVAGLTATVMMLLLILSAASLSIAMKLREANRQQRSEIYAHDIRLCQALVNDGHYLEAEKALLKWVPDNSQKDLRGFEWYFLWRRSHSSAVTRTIAHKLAAFDVAFIQDGTKLAIGRWGNTIDVWDLDRSQQLPTFRLPYANGPVFTLTTVPETNTLISGDMDGKITFWNTKDRKKTDEIKLDLPVTANWIETISLSPDGRYLAVGAGNWHVGHVHVWDRETNKCLTKLGEYRGSGQAVFLDQHTLAVTAQAEGRLQLWSTGNWQMSREIDLKCHGVGAMAVAQSKKTLVLGLHEEHDSRVSGRIELWDTESLNEPQRYSTHQDRIRAISFSPDGKLLAACGDDRFISILNRKTGDVKSVRSGHMGKTLGLAFSPDGQTLASVSNDGTANIWNVQKLLSRRRDEISLQSGESRFGDAAFLDDDSSLCVCHPHGSVRVYDLKSGDLKRSFEVQGASATNTQMTVSQDQRWLAVTRGNWPRKSAHGKVEIHNLEAGTLHSDYDLPNGLLYTRSSFSPDARHLAVCGSDRVVIIDVAGQRISHELLEGQARVKSTAFSPDGRLLACADVKGITHLFDTDRFTIQRAVRTDSKVADGVDFSPDSHMFVTAGFDNCVRLFDSESGRLLRQFPKCAKPIGIVRFSPNGKRIVTGGMFGKVRVWDVESGLELLSFDFFPAFYSKPTFSNDGQSLAVTCGPVARVFQAGDRENLSRLSVSELTDIVCQDLTVFEKN